MRGQWEELREQLNTNVFQSIDRLRATRLLGRQPTDISFDRDVAVIFVASDAVHFAGKTEFDDLLSDLRDVQMKRLRKRLRKRWPELFELAKVPAYKQLLGELIDEQIERLQAMVEELEKNADADALASVAESKLDQTPEAYRLLNYVMKARRELRVGIAAFEKYNKGLKDRGFRNGGEPQNEGQKGHRHESRPPPLSRSFGPPPPIPGYMMSPRWGAQVGKRVRSTVLVPGLTSRAV